jgi:hypothetical protein
MARPKKVIQAEPAAPQQTVTEIVQALQEAGRPELANQLLAGVVDKLMQGNKPVVATEEEVINERHEATRQTQTEHERQRQEPHTWITFNHEGEDDKVEVVELFPCGVAYRIRKGFRVPLPQSAINVLALAAVDGLDMAHPVMRDGKQMYRRKRVQRFSYQIDGRCTAEEAAQWRTDQAAADGQDFVQKDRDDEALQEISAGY